MIPAAFNAFHRDIPRCDFSLLIIPFCVGVFHLFSEKHSPDAHSTVTIDIHFSQNVRKLE